MTTLQQTTLTIVATAVALLCGWGQSASAQLPTEPQTTTAAETVVATPETVVAQPAVEPIVQQPSQPTTRQLAVQPTMQPTAQQPTAQQPTPEPQEQEWVRSTELFKERLAQTDSLSPGRVVVVEQDSTAADAVRRFDLVAQPREVYNGYRIRLYSGNNQQARAEAEAVQQTFREHYAVPIYFSYENPYFLVSCGNCLSHEEAIILLSKVRAHFPKAFIVACEIPAELIITPPVVRLASEVEAEALAAEALAAEVAEGKGESAEGESVVGTSEVAEGAVVPATEPASEPAATAQEPATEPIADGATPAAE